ncbi:MAG: hypothetical protein ACTSPI_00190 [Candidatus Heimdallarchaeaceae archaeon]
MAYELPLVRIYQQLEDVSPALASPDLPPCVIGRCYHVMTYADNKLAILTGEYDKTNGNTFTPPNNEAGALLNEDSIKLYFDDMYIELADGTFDAVLNEAKIADAGGDFVNDGVAVGDIAVIDHASLSSPIERTVIAVAALELAINKNFAANMTGATYSIRKKLDDRLMLASDYTVDDGDISVLPSLTHIYNSVSYVVMTGNMYLEYKALRTDLSSSVGEVSSVAEIESQLGVINSENPLALGAKLCRDNTTTPVKFIAIDTEEDDDTGWSSVKDILENLTSVYFLALLTDKASIISLFKTHCVQMSTADEHGWRVCSGGVEMPIEKEIVDEASTGEIYESVGVKYFRDNSAEFISDGVSPADRLELNVGGAITGSYVVNQVINDNVIEVTTTAPFAETGSGITYTIDRDLSKPQQADEIAGSIDSYDSRRVVVVFPDEIEVNGETVAGYFLGTVVAGMVAGLPPHQGFTNLTIAGVETLSHSNTYFKKEDLNKIANAGGLIFVQETPNSAPYIRHQLTTDTQFVETRELSVVKNFDHLSYYFYDVLAPFIGPYNVTNKTSEIILGSLRLAGDKKMAEALPRIGAPLKSYTLAGGPSSISSDRIEVMNRLDIPKPLNYIDMYLAI